MKNLKKFVGKELYNKYSSNHDVFQEMLNLLPVGLRRDVMKLHGLSPSNLAEIVTAYAKKTVAIDGHGKDFLDGSEGKYATIKTIYQKEVKRGKEYIYRRRKANVSNLKSKTGDLHIIVGDDTSGNMVLRFFSYPYKVWSSKISGNEWKMDFTNPTHKWYMDYEVSKKEFFV